MVKFAGLQFKCLTLSDVLKETDSLRMIITVNSEFVVKAQEDDKFRTIINNNCSTFDGQVPFFFAKVKNKNVYFEKLSGSSLIYDFCKLAKEKKKKIFLLGGYKQSNIGALKKLKEIYNIEIEGFSPSYKDYPFDTEHNKMILEKIESFKPDILFVGFGAVKQEYWINENKKELNKIGVKWAVGCGGTFEFVAGMIKRAPKLIQRVGLEGIWRLLAEPNLNRFNRLLISFKVFKYI